MFLKFALTLAVGAVLLIAPLQAAPLDPGAKGLFYEQLDQPSKDLNTGLQYWIEVHRGGKVMHVNNKASFQSGDRIRFHVRANVDGFAYIILKQGSGGDQAVLFPDMKHMDDTQLSRGREYILPNQGYLTFDQTPGTENLMMVLSKKPIDAAEYLKDPNNEQAMVAFAGSKDLIPKKVVVSYDSKARTVQRATTTKTMLEQTLQGGPLAVASNGSKSITVTPRKDTEPAMVTVVHSDPGSVLMIDIALSHQNP